MKKDDKTFYITVAMVIVLGFIVWWFSGNKDDKPAKRSLKGGAMNLDNNYNCIKVNIVGNDVREWVNFTFTVDGVKYDTVRRFVSNHRSSMVVDTSVNDNLVFNGLWKDGKYVNIPTLLKQNSNVSVELKFLASDFYPKTRIKSYEAEVINCP
jgi:hypothetical protein